MEVPEWQRLPKSVSFLTYTRLKYTPIWNTEHTRAPLHINVCPYTCCTVVTALHSYSYSTFTWITQLSHRLLLLHSLFPTVSLQDNSTWNLNENERESEWSFLRIVKLCSICSPKEGFLVFWFCSWRGCFVKAIPCI